MPYPQNSEFPFKLHAASGIKLDGFSDYLEACRVAEKMDQDVYIEKDCRIIAVFQDKTVTTTRRVTINL